MFHGGNPWILVLSVVGLVLGLVSIGLHTVGRLMIREVTFHPHEIQGNRPPIEHLPENRLIQKFLLRENELQPPSRIRAWLFHLEMWVDRLIVMPVLSVLFWIVFKSVKLGKAARDRVTVTRRPSAADANEMLTYLEAGGEIDSVTARQILVSYSESPGLSDSPASWKMYRDIFVEISEDQPEVLWAQREFILDLFERDLNDSILGLLATHFRNSTRGSSRKEAIAFVEDHAPWLVNDVQRRAAAAAATHGLAIEYPDIMKPKLPFFVLGVINGVAEVRYECLGVVTEICFDDPETVRPYVPLLIAGVSDVLTNPDLSVDRYPELDTAGRGIPDFDTEEFHTVYDDTEQVLTSIMSLLDECLAEIGEEHPETVYYCFEAADATPELLAETRQMYEEFEEAVTVVDRNKIWLEGVVETSSDPPSTVIERDLYLLRRASEKYPRYVSGEVEMDDLMFTFEAYDNYLIRREITATFAAIAEEAAEAIQPVARDLLPHFGGQPRQINERIAKAVANVARVDEEIPNEVCQRLFEEDRSSRRLAALTLYEMSAVAPEVILRKVPTLLPELRNPDPFTAGYIGAAVGRSVPADLAGEGSS